MRRLLAALLFVAAPASADEETVASSHRRDFPTSELYGSPADASRFGPATIGVTLSGGRNSRQADFGAGKERDDGDVSGFLARGVRKASPSLYWALVVENHEEKNRANNTLITGDRKLETKRARTEFGLEAAYKMMDKLVLGLGGKYRNVKTEPESGSGTNVTMPVLEAALMVRSEWYEAEVAQRAMSYDQNDDDGKTRVFRRQTTLVARYHSSASWTSGLILRRNPFPNCCLAPDSNRMTYGLSAEITSGEWKHELIYTYGPAFHDDGIHTVTLHGLSYDAFYGLSEGLTFQAGLAYEQGEEKGSEVRIPTAAGYVEEADVEESAWSLAAGVTLSI